MGPECPFCNYTIEWCERELNEQILFPQTYFCSECWTPFTLSVAEVKAVQQKYNQYLAGSTPSEKEEDWLKVRRDWDNGDLR